MNPLYVTGTDTGVGKTRVCAALGRAGLRHDGGPYRIVKLVQTGLGADERGDAREAAELAGCAWSELHRFPLAADPWSAALDAGAVPLTARALAEELAAMPGAAIVEGSGGAAVPLNGRESISDAARAAGCEAILVIGLRLGCINHALLTLDYLGQRGFALRGAVLCEAFGPTEAAYRLQVERAVGPHLRVAGTVGFESPPGARFAADAATLATLLP